MYSLDAEVDTDVERAKVVLAFVEEHYLPASNKLQDEAVSVLLQVLYALHQGRVQFLMGDYKARIIEAQGQADEDSSEDGEVRAQDTLPNKGQRLGKDGRPVMTHAGREFVHNSEQTQVDLLKEEDGESTDLEDSDESDTVPGGNVDAF